jgi:hypothetical protein
MHERDEEGHYVYNSSREIARALQGMRESQNG